VKKLQNILAPKRLSLKNENIMCDINVSAIKMVTPITEDVNW
jgi:hypothetical protein